eukprot:scaffold7178_cov80-Skeletonema_marinoi.AAC.2
MRQGGCLGTTRNQQNASHYCETKVSVDFVTLSLVTHMMTIGVLTLTLDTYYFNHEHLALPANQDGPYNIP